ncbi:LysR family transcriptional regulator [Lelliottia amnigena]
MINFSQLDLNLLLTLQVLLDELNVTRAARRLNLSQPSVSVQLARLRDVFNDPLLLPGPRGMRPTARADALREPLRHALAALESVVAPAASFEPEKTENTWRVAATDYMATAILLPALETLRQAAPLSRLAVYELNPQRILRQAEQGDIDLIFHTREGAPASLHQRVIFSERYVLAGRRDHPALRTGVTAKQFSQLEHAIVSPDGGGFWAATDVALARCGLARKVVLSVPHFLFLVEALLKTDLVAVVPERLTRNVAGLSISAPPVEVEGFDMLMLWHERLHRDAGHVWLRQMLMTQLG